MIKICASAIIVAALSMSCAHAASPEFRGAWVHNWQPGLLSQQEVDTTIKWAKDCNMNALILQVRRVGDAYYNSSYEPRALNIQGGPDFDPLAYAAKQARANGMEVHAWFNLYRIWSSAPPPADPRHVINAHPEWLSKDAKGATASPDGQFLDPGVPEVRAYLVKVIADLVGKYDIDGLSLDFVRYPGKDWGYNAASVALFNGKYGRTGQPSPDDPQWCDWRREQVTETVRAISSSVRGIKPNIKLTAATITWGNCPSDFTKTSAYSAVFQDWNSWMKEGLLDANMPMNYEDQSNPRQCEWFSAWLDGLKRWSYGKHVYCGLMIFKDNDSGAADQVKIARQHGIEGIVGFAWSQRDTAHNSALAAKLRGEVFAETTPVPEMTWKKAVVQGPKAPEAQSLVIKQQ